MDFLKKLFPEGGTLTFDQLAEKAKEQKLNLVNLAEGGYVSKGKFDDETKTLATQVKDLQGQLIQRDTDMEGLKTSLTAAQADASKFGAVQQSLADLQGKYTTDKTAFETRLSQQAYEFAVKEKANGLKFSSRAARNAFVQEAVSKGFKLDGGNLLGYEEFVTKYKTDDPGAFEAEQTPSPGSEPGKPTLVLPNSPGKTPAGDPGGFRFAFNGVRPVPKE